MTKLKLKIKYLCDDDAKRREGLMHKTEMDEDQCALFIFPRSSAHGFWNKNVHYDLSLACCDDNFVIVDFMELKADSENAVYPHNRNIKYVIEAKRGVFDKNGVNKGDYIDFDVDQYLLLVKAGSQENNDNSKPIRRIR